MSSARAIRNRRLALAQEDKATADLLMVALMIAGAMKAIDSVIVIWRTLQFCR
jgi:hypothetical protein